MNGENWEEMFYDIWKRKGNSFIEYLLDAGLDVNALNAYGGTMLSYAAKWGNLEITEFLVQKGADGNIENRHVDKPLHVGKPLHVAAQHGRKNIVKYYLNKGMSVDTTDIRKCTPLHWVAESNNSLVSRESCQEMVHFLVDSNANLEAIDITGRTPLLLATLRGNKHMVELFIKLGANVDCCDGDQFTVLHDFCFDGWLGTVQFLIDRKCDIDLNARTKHGDTPMLLASQMGHKDIVKLLLILGADPNCINNYQETILHFASYHGWLDIVKELVNAGCDMDATDKWGQTALYLSAQMACCDVVEFLIKKGANVMVCHETLHMTVLHHVCRAAAEGTAERWVDVAKFLVMKGSDINARDSKHNTPLHSAVNARNAEMVAYLLEAGADWSLKNTSGFTALNDCINQQFFYFKDIILLFLEKGAYFQTSDYIAIMKEPLLKQGILQNVDLCTQAVINHFNNAELPKMYKIPVLAERLPSIEKLKFASNGDVAQDIAKTLNDDILTKGYCDLLKVRPISLSCLCVRSLLKYYDNL